MFGARHGRTGATMGGGQHPGIARIAGITNTNTIRIDGCLHAGAINPVTFSPATISPTTDRPTTISQITVSPTTISPATDH